MARGSLQNLGANRGVGSGIANDVRLDCRESTPGVGADGVAEGDGVTFGVDPKRLLASQDNPHRSLQEPRGEGGMALHGEVLLAAKGAAVGNQLDLDSVAIDSQNRGDLALVVMHSLAL